MNAFEKFVYEGNHEIINKFPHYFEIYERHFSKFRGKPVTVAEIGIGHGGSLEMWADYFGSQARIIGIDIADFTQKVKEIGRPNVEFVLGDQGHRKFWEDFRERFKTVDILIDDGSHRSDDQRVTFEETFLPLLSENGVYLCEDLQTAYLPDFGGGYKSSQSFIEFGKDLVDRINAHSAELEQFYQFARFTYSVSFYCGCMVVEKRVMDSVLRSPVFLGRGA